MPTDPHRGKVSCPTIILQHMSTTRASCIRDIRDLAELPTKPQPSMPCRRGRLSLLSHCPAPLFSRSRFSRGTGDERCQKASRAMHFGYRATRNRGASHSLRGHFCVLCHGSILHISKYQFGGGGNLEPLEDFVENCCVNTFGTALVTEGACLVELTGSYYYFYNKTSPTFLAGTTGQDQL